MRFSETRLQAMRLAYGKVRDIPHRSEQHEAILKMLRALDRDEVEALAEANIRWLSHAARAMLAGKEYADFPREAHIRDNGWGFVPRSPKPNPDAEGF